MSCPRAWLQPQPVTHSPTGPGLSHGCPGDGKETHKHWRVGWVVWGEGGCARLGLPAMPSPTRASWAGAHLSRIMFPSGPTSRLCIGPERAVNPLTFGQTEARGHRPSCGRGLGPRLRARAPFPQPRGFQLAVRAAPGSGRERPRHSPWGTLALPALLTSGVAGANTVRGDRLEGPVSPRPVTRGGRIVHVCCQMPFPHPRQTWLIHPRTSFRIRLFSIVTTQSRPSDLSRILPPASLSGPCSICTVHPPHSCRRDPVRMFIRPPLPCSKASPGSW